MDANQYFELTQLYARYSEAMSASRWDEWPGFFTPVCTYRLQPRENYERGFPLATLSFESQGMLRDRVYGIKETLFHDPYYQRIVTGVPLVEKAEGGAIHCQANYAVFRTKLSELSTVYNVGRYIDIVVPTPEGLRFQSRLCIYDSEMIPNSVIYPI